MRPAPGRAVTGATLALALALIAFGYSLVRAIHVDTGSPQPLPITVPDDSADVPAVPPLSSDALMLAVENDPFQPDRVRPADRYRLPGDVEEVPPPPPPPAPPPPDFRLGGTVVFDDGGMALLGVGDGAQSFVNVGEAVNGYRLSAVTGREAVLENPFGSVVVEVSGPPATVAAADGENEGRGRRRGQRGEQDERREMTRQLLQQAVQRARQNGATPQQLQMMEALGERVGDPEQMMQMLQRILRSSGGAAGTRPTIEIPPPPPPPPGRHVPPAR